MSERPKFHEWLCERLGPKWVVARRTRRALEFYPDSTFVTHRKFNALREEYTAKWGNPYSLTKPFRLEDKP